MGGRTWGFGAGLLVCALCAGGCGSEDKSVGSGGTGGSAGAAGSGAQPSCDDPPAVTGDAKFDALASWFAATSRDWEVPGGMLAVYHDGELRTASYGSKKVTTCDPIGPSTRFNLARLSTPLTALVAIKMSESPIGNVDLDGKVVDAMPELKEHMKDPASKDRIGEVTLRHLLSGTSGYWPVYWSSGDCPDIAPAESNVEGPESLAAFFAPGRGTVVHEPGTVWMHSEPAVALAARVLETVSNEPFVSLAKKHFPSLDLTFDTLAAEEGDFAHAKAKRCGLLASTWGAHGTVDDIGKLIEALAGGGDGQLISSQELSVLLDAGSGVVSAVADTTPTLGFHHLPLAPYGTIAMREATVTNTNGFAVASVVALVPGNFGFIYIHNTNPGGVARDQIRERMLETYFPDFVAYDHQRDAATWSDYAGTYLADDGTQAQVEVVNAQLKLTLSAAGKSASYELSPGGFMYWSPTTRHGGSIDEDWFDRNNASGQPGFRFYRDASGKPTSIGAWVSEYQKAAIPGPFLRAP